MTVTTPEIPEEPEGPNDEAVVDAAIEIIRGEAETAQVETVFLYAAKVGVMLIGWRKMMSEGGFSKKWTEQAAMTLFEKFFTPFAPDYMSHGVYGVHTSGDDDDD